MVIISNYDDANELPEYVDVDYDDGDGEDPVDYQHINDKIEKAIEVTRDGLEQYENPAVMWTGGKDSTLVLYFVKEVAEQYDLEVPPAIFIDHYQHFDAIHDFVDRWADEWDLDVIYARNEDIGQYVGENDLEPGDDIPVDELGDHNRHHVENILEYEEETFPFLLDTYAGNHLLKTVALNDALEEYDVDGVISGVRWDEQEARADETFSPRDTIRTSTRPTIGSSRSSSSTRPRCGRRSGTSSSPTPSRSSPTAATSPERRRLAERSHSRRHPRLPEVLRRIPVARQRDQHGKSDEDPAWLQDLEGTTERAGRARTKRT